MGPILIILLLLALPGAVMGALFVAAVLLGRIFSTGADGDPPADLAPTS